MINQTLLEKSYPSSTQSLLNIRQVCDKLITNLNSLPRVINRNSKENYIDSLVKSHTVIYFCLSELSYMIERGDCPALSASIWGIFKVFNLIFEKNNFFFQNSINNLYAMNSQLQVAPEQPKTAPNPQVQHPQPEQHDLNFINQSIGKNEEKKNLCRIAVKKLHKEQSKLSFLDFTDTGMKEIEDRIASEEFEKEVLRCKAALDQGQHKVLSRVYDPLIITEVHKRVSKEMVTESKIFTKKLSENLLNLSQIDYHQQTDAAARELKSLLNELKEAPKADENVKYVPKKIFEQKYIDSIVEEVKEEILDSIDSKNKNLVKKSLEIFMEQIRNKQRDKTVQTEFTSAKMEKEMTEEVQNRVGDLKFELNEKINKLKISNTKIGKELDLKIKDYVQVSKQANSRLEEIKKLFSENSGLHVELSNSKYKIKEKDDFILILKKRIEILEKKKNTVGEKLKEQREILDHMISLYPKLQNAAAQNPQDEELFTIFKEDLLRSDADLEKMSEVMMIVRTEAEQEARQVMLEKFEISLQHTDDKEQSSSEEEIKSEIPKVPKRKLGASRFSAVSNVMKATLGLGENRRLTAVAYSPEVLGENKMEIVDELKREGVEQTNKIKKLKRAKKEKKKKKSLSQIL